MSSYNNSRKFDQNFYQGSTAMENQNGNGENGHSQDEFEDDGEGEFVVICKKHHQRGTKTRMRGRGGGVGGGGFHHHYQHHHHHHQHTNSYRIPLTAYPYHPSNLRRTQMLLEQQNNVKNNNGDNSSTATTETNSTNDSSIAKNSLPSSSSGTSTLSTASGPASDASSNTTGDVNVNELQQELDAIAKPKFVEAPIPTVNPWKVFNAAAVLSQKVKPTGVTALPSKKSSINSEPMTNGVSSINNTVAKNKPNGTSENAADVIPATTAPAKTWAAISSEKATKPSGNTPAQTVTRQTIEAKPATTPAKPASDSTTTTTASSPAQSSAPSPGPWVSGRVLKLQQSSPNYTEKLRPTEWPSLSEVSKVVVGMGLTDEPTVNGALETKADETARKTPEENKTHQKQMDSKESRSHTPVASSTYARTEYYDGESRGRGRGRGRGGSSRGGRGGRPSSASGHYKDQSNYAASSISSRTDYTDYPPDYTTLLPPFSTVPDFIMPYVAPTTCRVAPIMSPDLAVQQWVITTPAPREAVVEMVKKQIEYYFSQENLEKDFYLRRKMDAEGYLPIRLIASFQRVQSMTTEFNVVTEAIQSSSNLEMRQGTAVRTKHEWQKWPIDDGGHTQTRNGEDSATTTKVPCTLDE